MILFSLNFHIVKFNFFWVIALRCYMFIFLLNNMKAKLQKNIFIYCIFSITILVNKEDNVFLCLPSSFCDDHFISMFAESLPQLFCFEDNCWIVYIIIFKLLVKWWHVFYLVTRLKYWIFKNWKCISFYYMWHNVQ